MIPRVELAHRLAQLNARLQTLLRRALTDQGVSLAAARTLATLHRDGPRRVTDLAAVEQVTQPSMSDLVARLEAAGLVTRGSDASDRRLAIVSITDAGEARLASILERRTALLASRLAELSAEDQRALAGALPALEQLVALMEERIHARA
jgi:DNA-binding MarR family transcriptional regulator